MSVSLCVWIVALVNLNRLIFSITHVPGGSKPIVAHKFIPKKRSEQKINAYEAVTRERQGGHYVSSLLSAEDTSRR